MAKLLADKWNVKKTNSAALLTDPADQTYRKLMLQRKAGKTTSVSDIQNASAFKYNTGHIGELDITNKKRLGAEFVKSADQIMLWANEDSDPKRKKAAKQGVEVFEALVTHGFTTAYGLRITDLLLTRFSREINLSWWWRTKSWLWAWLAGNEWQVHLMKSHPTPLKNHPPCNGAASDRIAHRVASAGTTIFSGLDWSLSANSRGGLRKLE